MKTPTNRISRNGTEAPALRKSEAIRRNPSDAYSTVDFEEVINKTFALIDLLESKLLRAYDGQLLGPDRDEETGRILSGCCDFAHEVKKDLGEGFDALLNSQRKLVG